MTTAFPSLSIRRTGLEPRGSFAQNQAQYLDPDPLAVEEIARICSERKIGIVAHFYMDVELQGVLAACEWPHIQISDSLAMADRAVTMAEAGIKTVIVLGVDFMSENVRAVLDAAGHRDVGVYRLAATPIGCSLAESAERDAYRLWLQEAASNPKALHVVYINTSLITKARAQHILPTITCTSSNVLQTLLQAAAQVPDVEIFYGPDTYMGANLQTMLRQFSTLSDAAIRAIHPAHDGASIRSLLDRFHFFGQGVCVVHHLFGEDVVRRVRTEHPDSFHTAHLEVPGEMFQLAIEAEHQGRGVVGSTSNILDFILEQVERTTEPRLSFVLGTEAGMITSIVKGVRTSLANRSSDLEVEIVFPVASEAIAQDADSGLGILPGVAGGEGCATAGGCATCPFMKMNDLEALLAVLGAAGTDFEDSLTAYRPRLYTERINGASAAEIGCIPILHMRDFQRTGALSDTLVQDIHDRQPRRHDSD
jgi:quinolinate synthase